MTGAQVGSAVHELMQRVPLEEEITLDTLHQALGASSSRASGQSPHQARDHPCFL